MEYGGRRGMWNILEVLDACGVKATFFVCGATAENIPMLSARLTRTVTRSRA